MFEWNAAKAVRNAANHQGVTFEEAATVFNDARMLIEPDYDHSEYEQRFWASGFSEQGRILLVVFVYRGENIHLISARKATPRERTNYGNQTD